MARRGKRAKRSRNAKTSPHPASGIRAPLPDATLTRLIRPTTLCLNRRPDKAFMPHPAGMRRCQMRHPKAAHPQ
ncbi:hypothetical protein HMPREF1608_04499 [Escherichia coli 908525]|nr:hypothetical protein HMPREF1608_04499 [Escherichia coli 908525]